MTQVPRSYRSVISLDKCGMGKPDMGVHEVMRAATILDGHLKLAAFV
jgi:hypothetical protein